MIDIATNTEQIKEHLENGKEVILWDCLNITELKQFLIIEKEILDYKDFVLKEYKKRVAPKKRGTREKDKEIFNSILKCNSIGMSDIEAIKKTGLSRATYYRFKKILQEQKKL